MAAAGDKGTQMKSLEIPCDEHKKTCVTFCKEKSTLLCEECLPNHMNCETHHINKTDNTRNNITDTNTLSSDLKQLKKEQKRAAPKQKNKPAFDTKSEENNQCFAHQHKECYMQEQVQERRQRQLEASKEMLYGVYGNVIMTLAEYAGRKDEERITETNKDAPDQSWKTFEDVEANLESQLVVFEAQLNACPTVVSDSVKRELRIQTIFMAVNREGQEMSSTDAYLAQLYEILVKGKTNHRILNEARKKVSAGTIIRTIPLIFWGKNKASEIDQSYESNPSKRASRPEFSSPNRGSYIHEGASRLCKVISSLSQAVDSDILHVTGNAQ